MIRPFQNRVRVISIVVGALLMAVSPLTFGQASNVSGIGSFNLQNIDPAELARLAAKMRADRLLLAEVRKDIPDTRAEAKVYLDRLKQLAAQSDPVNLVPLINKVLSQAPIYYDWLDKKFKTPSDRVAEYYVGGARGFSFALDEFKNAVLLTVINRLDVASQIMDNVAQSSGSADGSAASGN